MKKAEYLQIKETLDEQIALLAERARENTEDSSLLYGLISGLAECNQALVNRFFKWPPSDV